MKTYVAAALACAALFACSKADKKGEEPPPRTRLAAKVIEGAAPPPGAAALAAPSAQDDFASLELDEVPEVAKNPAQGKAIRAADVSTAGIPTQQVKGFTGAAVTGFRVSYQPDDQLTSDLHKQFASILREVQLYEEVAKGLNSTLKLPRVIDIQLAECGTVNAFYDPNNSRILMCYELMSYFADMFKPVTSDTTELGNAILGATMFAFFHEAGHGLVHQLDLPVMTAEEQVVDSLATLILIAGGEESTALALSGAYWFQLQSQQGHATPFSDEHPLDQQRFYNILCWIYGSDPAKYQGFVSSGTLPEARAARCGEEYATMKARWEKVLAPHLSSDAAQAADIAPAAPPPPPASGHAISCEQVVQRGLEVYLAELEAQLGSATPEQLAQVRADLEVQLPQLAQQAVDECTKNDWSDAARQCVMNAKDSAALEKCGV